MKKLFITVLAVIAVVGVVSAAVVTNELGQVITTTSSSDGVTVSIAMPSSSVNTNDIRTQANLPGLQISTNASTTVTQYTPRDLGDILVGFTGGTGTVWAATGVTTNDWKQLTN